MLEGMLRTCVLDHKGRGLIALSGIRLQQQLSGECTNGTIRGIVWKRGWTEVEESSITGPDLIRDTYEKVSLI